MDGPEAQGGSGLKVLRGGSEALVRVSGRASRTRGFVRGEMKRWGRFPGRDVLTTGFGAVSVVLCVVLGPVQEQWRQPWSVSR